MPTARELVNAGERLHTDGAFLDDSARSRTADHLFGLAAECAIKAILHGVGGLQVHNDAPVRPFREHVDVLWPLAAGVISGLTAFHYSGPLLRPTNPFSDWKVDHRYGGSPAPSTDAVRLHRLAAQSMVVQTQLARLDGLL